MSYYMIGIGGTGAKCVEAFVHLCAAGLMPDNRAFFALFVDPDGSNGSLKRAGGLLQNYYDCHQMKLGSTDLFKSGVRIARPDIWSPLQNKPSRLEEFFNYNTLERGAASLFDVLYSPKEKQTALDYGFRGHPSIGAAVMAAAVKLGGEEPWASMRDQISLDVKVGEGAKVILFGSIFGGTGASGVPTIGRLVSDEFSAQLRSDRFKIGSVLMLPYFSFDPVKGEKMRVDADTFLLSTQSALKYYHKQDELKVCNAVYLLGNETLKPMRNSSIGGQEQDNEPHLLEMYAALAAMHFFANDNVNGYPHVAREASDRTSWTDLPYFGGFAHFKQKVNQLARFAFAYLSSYYPMLESINNEGRDYRAPWYVNLMRRRKVALKSAMQEELKDLKTYCESFLLWLANIEQSQTGDNMSGAGHLINFNAFAEGSLDEDGKQSIKVKSPQAFNLQAFDNLLLPITSERPDALSALWEEMSNARINDPNADGVGRFAKALYEACSIEST